MANACKICQFKNVKEINAALAADTPVRTIANTTPGVSLSSVRRHKEKCLKQIMADVIEVKRAGLLASVDEIKAEIRDVKQQFVDNPNVRLGVIGKLLDALDKEAKLTGAYIQDKPNPDSPQEIARRIADDLMRRDPALWTPELAMAAARDELGMDSETVH